MQPKEIQQPINPWQACTANTHLTLTLNAKLFTRAEGLLFEPFNQLSFVLNFSQTEDKQMQVTGNLAGEVNLECQRCLQPVAVKLNNEFAWGLVNSDADAANLNRDLEPVYLQANKLDVFAALEDELLLSLPLVAYHEEDDCQVLGKYQTEEIEPQAAEKPNKPFLVLHQLKKGRDE